MFSTAYKPLDVTNVFCWLASDINISDIMSLIARLLVTGPSREPWAHRSAFITEGQT